jgi:hypothetical protein
MEKYEIGRGIEAYCTKCNDDTAHVITAMEGRNITKVMCQVCYSYHKFKPPRDQENDKPAVTKKSKVTSKSGKTPKKRVRRVTIRKSDSWSDALEKADTGEAVDYYFAGSYENGNVLNHKKFGLGVVRKVLSEQKIEVLFESGMKTLIQNWEEE